jgi:flagellar hook protein FlgE
MASIVNGLLSARSGIGAHGAAIAVVGDNIANGSTIGFKASRADFSDLLSGGQPANRTIGSGTQLAAVVTPQTQGTLEFTSRPLDLAIDGKGFFIVATGAQRFFTRAGNLKVDPAGFVVDSSDRPLLGYPTGGTGALEPMNINTVSQSGIESRNITVAGNLNASAPVTAGIPPGALAAGAAAPVAEPVTYTQLNNASQFSTVVDAFDSLGAKHTLTMFFFKTGSNTWQAQAYAPSNDVDPSPAANGFPRRVGPQITLNFNPDGTRSNTPPIGTGDLDNVAVPWNNGASGVLPIDLTLRPFTQYSASSNIVSITQDGRGVGAVTSANIEKDGRIFAVLDNGQTSLIGTVGLVSFSNPEGLKRIGGNLLQQSVASGEPVFGRPLTGGLGPIQAGSIELSNVDTASEFVKLITLQRGFQANSRIISTINQLLNEVVQLT